MNIKIPVFTKAVPSLKPNLVVVLPNKVNDFEPTANLISSPIPKRFSNLPFIRQVTNNKLGGDNKNKNKNNNEKSNEQSKHVAGEHNTDVAVTDNTSISGRSLDSNCTDGNGTDSNSANKSSNDGNVTKGTNDSSNSGNSSQGVEPTEFIGLDGLHEALAAMSYEDIDDLAQSDLDLLALGRYGYERGLEHLDQGNRPTAYVAITYGQIIEGLAQLAASGVAEITDIISALHCEILLRPIGRFDDDYKEGWDASIIGQAYSLVRTAVKTVGNGVSLGVRTYNQKLIDYNLVTTEVKPVSYRLKLLVNALNGIMGDRLVSQNNPLAVKMALYTTQGTLQKGKLSGNVYILVHGLCMSHLGWRATNDDGLGVKLQQSQPNSTVLYLDYNTGRRIADNGRQLSNLLHTLVHENPDISRINLIGHSMGGLVSRSALFYGEQQRHDWLYLANTLITIGSPHQGAILEQMGNYMVALLSELPFAGSLVKLADLRSAGIIDLRHGSIQDADWKTLEGRQLLPQGFLHPAPPPNHVTTYLIAGTLVGGLYNSATSNLVGDGLVAVESALGEEHEADKDVDHVLPVPEGQKAVFHGVGHMNLLFNDRVHQQIIEWLNTDVTQYAFEPCIHSFEEALVVEV